MCEYLVSRGHNTADFNPYLYSFKKLYQTFEVQKSIANSTLRLEQSASHLSRAAMNSGDQKGFIELLESISEEE